MIGDAPEDITQVSERVDAAQLAGFDQTVDRCGAGAAAVGAGEQPVFATKRDTAQGVFGTVVIDLQPAVVEVAGQRRPVA